MNSTPEHEERPRRSAFEKLGIAIVGALLVFIVVIYSAYFYKEASAKYERREATRISAEANARTESEVAALSLEELLEEVKTSAGRTLWLEARLMSGEFWRPASQPSGASVAEREQLARVITALAASRYSNYEPFIDRVASADPAIREQLLTALLAGLARRESLDTYRVGKRLFERGGAAFFKPAIAPLSVTREDQLRIASEWIQYPSATSTAHLEAWKRAGLPMPPPPDLMGIEEQ